MGQRCCPLADTQKLGIGPRSRTRERKRREEERWMGRPRSLKNSTQYSERVG